MIRQLSLILVILAGGCLAGCTRIKKIGHLSEQPILRVTVGTTVELRWPEITYEADEEAAAIADE